MLKTLIELLNLLKAKKTQLIISIILSFLDGFLLIVPIIISCIMISSIPELFPAAKTTLSVENVIIYTIIMVLCMVIRMILRYFTLRLRSGAGYEVMCEKRKSLGLGLRNVSMGYFNQKNYGDLVSTITSDASFIELDGLGVVERAANGIPSMAIGLGLLFFLDYKIAIMVVILLIPTYFAYVRLFSTQDRYGINRQNLVGKVTEDVIEFIDGLKVLKIYNMVEKQFFKTKISFATLKELSIKLEMAHLIPIGIYNFCFRLITSAIIILSCMLALKEEITYPYVFLLILCSFSIFTGAETMGIYSIFSRLAQFSIDRLKEIDRVPVIDNIDGKSELGKFDVQFENVTFAYEERNVLESISFRVPEKTTTALVGLSGSGKTTITNLISRFWDVNKGKILIGGKDVKSLNYERLLQSISFVFQDVFLFKDTVLNNICVGRHDATIEEIIEASKLAGCHEFIIRMKDGYDTMIGEGGETLSGGERQRISIARALIKNAPIVLLDEVTANVDVENERSIQLALTELLSDKTVIMIAHKLSTIQDVDQILVMDNGKIIQRGKHEELMNQLGMYKHLWTIQFKASRWKL